MRKKEMITIAACFLGLAIVWGQGPPAKRSLEASQDPREAAVLAQCKNPRLPAPDYGQPQLGLRDYKVVEIPDVIAAGQKWKSVWQQMGDNGDGIVGSLDGGLLIAQNDSSDVLKLDVQGKPSVAYTDTNTGGSLSMTRRARSLSWRGASTHRFQSLRPIAKSWLTTISAIPWIAAA